MNGVKKLNKALIFINFIWISGRRRNHIHQRVGSCAPIFRWDHGLILLHFNFMWFLFHKFIFSKTAQSLLLLLSGLNPGQEEIDEMIEETDRDNSGAIDFRCVDSIYSVVRTRLSASLDIGSEPPSCRTHQLYYCISGPRPSSESVSSDAANHPELRIR